MASPQEPTTAAQHSRQPQEQEQQHIKPTTFPDLYTPPPGSKSISSILADARSHLTRLTPSQALAYILTPPSPPPSPSPSLSPSLSSSTNTNTNSNSNPNANPNPISIPTPTTVLVDIRPAAQRAAEGSIAGALLVERNVLEWRFDPQCEARLPFVGRYDMRVVVMCQEGYTSSLAARALQELGLGNATDVVGGFRAWREEGLPGVVELLVERGGGGGGGGGEGEGKDGEERIKVGEDGRARRE